MSAPAAFAAGAGFGALLAGLVSLRVTRVRRHELSGPLHELRGALAAIQLGLFALERPGRSASPERVDALRMQAERAHAAVEEVDEVRTGRRSSSRQLELVEAGAIVRRRVAAWSGLAETRRRVVELRWPIGPTVVRADPARVGQALDNLIVNAIDHGSGIVRVTGARTEETVRIAVSDQGPGFARPLREMMQSPWHGRHGHGLAVAARAAELHGGRLMATSGRIGSRVEIELPLAEPVAEKLVATRGAAPGGSFELQPVSGGRR